MFVIIRSRFWLFPGILDRSKADAEARIVNKSQIEAEEDEEHQDFDVYSKQVHTA